MHHFFTRLETRDFVGTRDSWYLQINLQIKFLHIFLPNERLHYERPLCSCKIHCNRNELSQRKQMWTTQNHPLFCFDTEAELHKTER
jgi:hypothetical protein